MPITIGIPFYNARCYLADAIRSVFAQTYQDWELILVDDGSTDGSLDIARSVRDPRVRVVSDGKNRKLAYRLNEITALAKYGYIARMDADDLMSPTRLELQHAVLESDKGVDLISTGVCSLSNDNNAVAVRGKAFDGAPNARELLLGRAGIVHASILGRREWFLRNPYGLSSLLAEDYELWLSACRKGDLRIRIIGEPLYYYRESGNVTKEKLLTAYRSQRAILSRYGDIGFGPVMRRVIVGGVHAKSFSVMILSAFGRLDLLLKRRSEAIEDPVRRAYLQREIESVLGTRVPGLDYF